MIKLIKNEFYKLFHKKSTYITLVIGLLFLVLVNFIYSLDIEDALYSFIDYNSFADEYEEEAKSADLSIEDKVFYQTEIAKYRLLNDYHNEWQSDAIETVYNSSLEAYYTAYFNNEEDVSTLKEKVDLIKEKITSNDYKYFLNLKLEAAKESLDEIENRNVNSDLAKKNKKIDLEIANETIRLYEYAIDNDIAFDGSFLGNALSSMLISLPDLVSYKYESDENIKKGYEESVKSYFENEYIIKNKIDTNNMHSLRSVIINLFDEIEIIIIVFIIMIAGSMVSDEFNKGTIKNLLTVPFTRGKIVLAKLITCFLCIPLISLVFVIGELIIGGIFFGYSSLNIPYISYSILENKMYMVNPFIYLIEVFASKLPMYTLLMVLSFLVSTVFLNGGLAIAITFFGYVASSIINLFATRLPILKFFVTTNWQFKDYLCGGVSEFGIPLWRSSITCLIYLVIMLIVIFVVFKKRNVKNI